MVRGGICARLSAPVSYEQPMTITRDFALDAKYRREEGLIFLSGIQALVRLPLDQHRADRRRGLNTATLISGYRGSPLGGLDLTLERNPDLLREHNVVFISGLNEDLGATAIYGSQLAGLFPRPKYDGVLGMWYGKGPGVDRTGDIFKHANYAGVARHGGVLALGGDDPLSKSSTLPSHSEVAFYDLREALHELGLDDAELRQHGIRLLKIGMLFPMEPTIVREFARGLEELLVIEEKRSFCELFIREILYNDAERPRVLGKSDLEGRPLVPADAELDADRIAQIVATRLERKIPRESITARVALLGALRERPAPLTLARQPYFCSGCPHNRSTVLPEGSIASAGIGCHGMALLMDRRTMRLTHMGGEGVQWVGMAPFTETPHIFQNLGDGTFFHSGSLAVRQAIAAGTNITYKILYNSAVAITGGQDAAGAMPGPG